MRHPLTTGIWAGSQPSPPSPDSPTRRYLPYLCAAAVADRLGTSLVEFPGGHAGFISHPRAFAEKLRNECR
jgi:hypothetical protein